MNFFKIFTVIFAVAMAQKQVDDEIRDILRLKRHLARGRRLRKSAQNQLLFY